MWVIRGGLGVVTFGILHGHCGSLEEFCDMDIQTCRLEEGLGVFLSGRLRVQIISSIKCIRETKSLIFHLDVISIRDTASNPHIPTIPPPTTRPPQLQFATWIRTCHVSPAPVIYPIFLISLHSSNSNPTPKMASLSLSALAHPTNNFRSRNNT
jgi:hypothetical protein